MCFLFTRKLYFNTVNEIFVQFHCLSSHRNDGFLKKKDPSPSDRSNPNDRSTQPGKRDAFQPRFPGFFLPVPTERERALYLSIRSDG